jgi:hypothetical protein
MKKCLFASLATLALIGAVSWVCTSDRVGVTRLVAASLVDKNVPSLPQNVEGAGANESKKTALPMSLESDEIAHLLARALDAMRQKKSANIDVVLVHLDEVLGGGRGNAGVGIAAILEFLRTGQDAETGRGFVIGDGGVLTESTTLRVYLIDKLGQLSRAAGSEAALGVAREILRTFGSADEWAVSMRNVAWSGTASREFLQDRILSMLNHREWCEQPSNGMLESFDVIVHTRAMVTVPELSRLVSVDHSPLARAASVALDRLAGQTGGKLTSVLNQQPELLAAAPLVRADLFAHADLGVTEQRQQVEKYLLRPDVDARERKKFFGSLIQTGQFLSYNLITPALSPETPDQAAARLEVLTRTVNGWMRDTRLSALNDELTALGNKVNHVIDEIAADESSK